MWTFSGIKSNWNFLIGMNQLNETNSVQGLNISRGDGSLKIDKVHPCDVPSFVCTAERERVNGTYRPPKKHFVTLRVINQKCKNFLICTLICILICVRWRFNARVVTKYVFSSLIPFCEQIFWSLIPKAWPIFVPDPSSMVQPDTWSLKKLMIPVPWSVIPDPRAVISDPILLIPNPTPLIHDPTYLVTTLWCACITKRVHKPTTYVMDDTH